MLSHGASGGADRRGVCPSAGLRRRGCFCGGRRGSRGRRRRGGGGGGARRGQR